MQNQPCSPHSVWVSLYQSSCELWSRKCNVAPKLRTYRTFKTDYSAEPYVLKILSRKHGSVIARLRSGILPLAIETGR